MKYVLVTALDGTKIPVMAHLVGMNAIVKVEGDGSCRLNGQDAYLVTVVNKAKGKALSEKVQEMAKEQGKDQVVDKVEELIKEDVIPAVLRALSLNKAATYMVQGLEFLAKTPVKWVTGGLSGIFLDSTDTGQAKEGYYRQPLPGGDSAIIRWIGEPSDD